MCDTMELFSDDVHQTVLNEETLRDSTARVTPRANLDWNTTLEDGVYEVRYTLWEGLVPVQYSFNSARVTVRDGVFDAYCMLMAVDVLALELHPRAESMTLVDVVTVNDQRVEVYLEVDTGVK